MCVCVWQKHVAQVEKGDTNTVRSAGHACVCVCVCVCVCAHVTCSAAFALPAAHMCVGLLRSASVCAYAPTCSRVHIVCVYIVCVHIVCVHIVCACVCVCVCVHRWRRRQTSWTGHI